MWGRAGGAGGGTGSLCHSMATAALCSPGLQLPGAQVAVSRIGSGGWGDTGMGRIGAALGLSAAMES